MKSDDAIDLIVIIFYICFLFLLCYVGVTHFGLAIGRAVGISAWLILIKLKIL